MSDYIWLTTAGVICIIISYGLGLQVGYKKGKLDALRDEIKRKLNAKYGINPLDRVLDYKEGKRK